MVQPRRSPRTDPDLAQLSARLGDLAASRQRVILGVTGPPGAGKSTIASYLATAMTPPAVIVPFDGFHLANQVLRDLARQNRKGAIDTFDLAGYRALLHRLRAADGEVVYAPTYSRDIEESIAGAVPISREARVVITEGNYLLAAHPAMEHARLLLDEVWYLDADDVVRIRRLIERHIRSGKSPAEARAWAIGTDEANAELVRASRWRADLVVHVE